ncbi:hypothetical protein GCM10009839_30070 [Catenulispora yoronensis]|uniref:Peptidase M48 domain-containing protein n=1 Tax=Catenulispora yoronensis TaxID=450799 RepID=A0ABN2U4M1_9ACTN
MRVGVRAAVAALLLLSFYALLAAVTWFGVLIVRRAFHDPAYAASARVAVALFGLLFMVPAIRVLNTAVRKQPPVLSGVGVSREQQPELWALVEQLARACGVAVPTRIVVTGEVNAAAQSSAAWFGTLRRERTVYLGLPLLAALDTAQAAGVLCHELGHHASGDSRLSALTYRSTDALLATFRKGRLWAVSQLTERLFSVFAGLYLSVTFAVRRRQESSADQLAARVAGSEAVATALDAIPLTRAAYAAYLQGATSEEPRTPAELAADLDGFRELLDSDAVRLVPGPDKRPNLFDSHPPLAERVAAIRKTAHEATVSIAPGRAIGLVREPAGLARAVAALSETA